MNTNHHHLTRLLAVLLAVATLLVPWSSRAYYWDPDANPANNVCDTGAGMGGTGSWGTTAIWEDGSATGSWCTAAAKAWSSGQTAYFWGTAGTVTLSGGRTAGGLTFKTGSYTVTGSTLTLNGDGVLTSETGTATLTTTLAGTVGYKVVGPGTIYLNQAANTITGPVNVSGGGTLRLATSASIGGTGVGSGDITLDGGTYRNDATTAGGTFLTSNRPIIVGAGGGTVNVAATPNYSTAAGVLLYSGIISGTGNTLTKAGVGELRCSSGANTFGKLVVNAGTFCCSQSSAGGDLSFGALPASATADAITLNAGGIVTGINVTTPANRGITLGASGGSLVIRGSTVIWTIGSPITGTGSLYINGINGTGKDFGGSNAEFRLTGASGYTGNTFLRFGTLRVSSGNNRLPTSTVVTMGSTAAAAKLALGITTAARDQTLAGLATAADSTGASVVNGAPTDVTAPTYATLTLNQNTDTTFSGVIGGTGDNENNLILVKGGTGTLTLTGVNTYTNATTVNAGTLAVTTGSINGSTSVTVAGGTLSLGGNNKLSDAATVNLAGGTLAMGSSSDTVAALQFDGTPKVAGTWGAIGSNAAHQSSRFSGSGILTVTSGPATTTTVDPIADSCQGTAVDLTATVIGNSPGGTVQFYDNISTALGTPQTPSSGTATLSYSGLSAGPHSITAVYSGDDNNYGSTSAAVSANVHALPTISSPTYNRSQGLSLKIPISDLTSGTLQTVGSPSHGSVSTVGGSLVYESAGNLDDSFTFVAANGYFCTVSGTVSIHVVLQAAGQAETPEVPASGPVTVRFAGIPSLPYLVERATDVNFTTGLQTWPTNAPAGGVFQIQDDFSDLGLSRPTAAWYRLKYNP